MKPGIIEQIHRESDTWKRLLEFIKQENGYLMSRLSEILKNKKDLDELESAEYFQSRILAEEDVIKLLNQNIREFDRLALKEEFVDGEIIKLFKRNYIRLKNEMEETESDFTRLKSEFRNYVTGINEDTVLQ